MTPIAGHLFRETLAGSVCDCGARWRDVLGARREDINTLGWAHTGALLEREYLEIEAERERVWAAVAP